MIRIRIARAFATVTVATLATATGFVAAGSTAAQASYPTLRSGSHGAAVLTLQKRLAALHYDIGSADGSFGSQTLHAVIAFQKVNGLSRTGVVAASTWSRLSRPSVPRPRYARTGTAIEVNLGRQVAFRIANGAIVAIYDVSTGRPSLPTPVSGSRPFHIWKKAMWGSTGYNDSEHYVQYFYRGSLLAFHAYGYVPTFPASHGCIRMPPASAARFWARTYVGEHVYTY